MSDCSYCDVLGEPCHRHAVSHQDDVLRACVIVVLMGAAYTIAALLCGWP